MFQGPPKGPCVLFGAFWVKHHETSELVHIFTLSKKPSQNLCQKETTFQALMTSFHHNPRKHPKILESLEKIQKPLENPRKSWKPLENTSEPCSSRFFSTVRGLQRKLSFGFSLDEPRLRWVLGGFGRAVTSQAMNFHPFSRFFCMCFFFFSHNF